MRWQKISDLGLVLLEIYMLADRLVRAQIAAGGPAAERILKLIVRGGPLSMLTERPRVTVEVSGMEEFEGWNADADRSMRSVIEQMRVRLYRLPRGCALPPQLSLLGGTTGAAETLMRELTELAVDFCGQPKSRQEEPRFSLEIELLGSVATVRLVFEDVKAKYQTDDHRQQAVFRSSTGTALDGVASVLAQARAHFKARERRGGW